MNDDRQLIRDLVENWVLGGTSIDLAGDRAIAQTKMPITQRANVHDVECDVVCTGWLDGAQP